MSEASPVESQNAMMSAADELFEGSYDAVTFADGREVVIKAAKVKHLRQITLFVQTFIQEFQPEELVSLLSRVSARQQAMIAEGSSPYALNTSELVKDVAGEASLFLRIVSTGIDAFAKLVPMFSEISCDEFEELDLDDAAVLIFGVFGRNYHFFIQRVLPVIQGCIAQRITQPSPKTTSAPGQ